MSAATSCTLLPAECNAGTYAIERLHSKNMRRACQRIVTHRVDMSFLGLAHAGYAGPAKLQHKRKSHDKHDKGKQKEQDVVDTDPVAEDSQKRGGGGGRAFCHLHMAGRKFTGAAMQQLSLRYQALSAEERQYYKDVGKAGSE